MGDLIASVVNNEVQIKNRPTENKSNELGKDAFLQLLTTQMKYQDPLNPNTDTEYIAQLATFSQLEQLQNLSTAATNSQAFNLIGKTVSVKTENSAGDTTYIGGRVDFVMMNGSKAQISINGNLYSVDQLDSVISDEFILEQNRPGVMDKTELKYDAANPKDLTLEVSMGAGETIADDVAIVINNKAIDSQFVDVSGTKVSIKKEAFADYQNGIYQVTVAFNDPTLTTVRGMVTLQVVNATTEA